jgi:hypothetical protein
MVHTWHHISPWSNNRAIPMAHSHLRVLTPTTSRSKPEAKMDKFVNSFRKTIFIQTRIEFLKGQLFCKIEVTMKAVQFNVHACCVRTHGVQCITARAGGSGRVGLRLIQSVKGSHSQKSQKHRTSAPDAREVVRPSCSYMYPKGFKRRPSHRNATQLPNLTQFSVSTQFQ